MHPIEHLGLFACLQDQARQAAERRDAPAPIREARVRAIASRLLIRAGTWLAAGAAPSPGTLDHRTTPGVNG